ncbi:ATP-binding protein [Porticoccus sp. W117]|uniref:ATP-binding protein n=1 Tax=Porticoccus sp. W117 TaxID=3054777 RepID=UPI0025971E45|nr:ATP-binding protein [Porticoccus sp. W117]MDM3871998.1 ATP-binding protein [Porticoccus sp. W117]
MPTLPPNSSALIRRNLKRLNLIRCIAIGGQFLALYYFWVLSDIGLPGNILAIVLLIYSAVLAASIWRSHWRAPLTEAEFFAHLLADMVFFSALLYFSGGASNPFVSYYLVPICIAAATLPRSYSWLIAALSLLAYSALFYYNHPVMALAPHHHHHGGGDGANLHLVGMWANFAVSAALITFFISRMAADLRRQEATANRLREDELRNNQVLAVATLAAGTAHELGTPLNTMQLLLDDMADSKHQDSDDISVLQEQVKQCRATLQRLVNTAEIDSDQQQPGRDLRQYLEELFTSWQVMRPDARPEISWHDNCPTVDVHYPPTVAQSIHNILNNAADASPRVEIAVQWGRQQLQLTVRDFGDGLTPEQREQMGQPFTSSKASGMGLGLFLTHTTFNRIGGQVLMDNVEGGGTMTQVLLPLAEVPPQ